MSDKKNVEGAEKTEEKAGGSEENLWLRYMDFFVKREEHMEARDKLNLRKPAALPNFPYVESKDEFPVTGYPANLFNNVQKTGLPNRLKPKENINVWNRMSENPAVDMFCFVPDQIPSVSKTSSDIWPGVYPCIKSASNSVLSKSRRKFGEACRELKTDETKVLEPKDDFANHIELRHARIPPKCLSPRSNPVMTDRSNGPNYNLVNGDYILTEMISKKKGNRVYANVCLPGVTSGMNLGELDVLRSRENTWKWCFYQAIVALLVKTQLIYKNAWSGNVDYIYDQGWSLFTHIGTLNVRRNGSQKFHDLGVYNYKYNVEVELIQELRDIPTMKNVGWDFVETNFGRVKTVERKELVRLESKFGSEKIGDQQTAPVHRNTREIEKWFDEIPLQYENCIFRTTRYCLAFWKDEHFWFLYNPYRCDERGFWNDDGSACIVKFSSRNALKRHLMILMIRAYAYELRKPGLQSDDEKKADLFTVQIFHLQHSKCELTNLKLLSRGKSKENQCLVKENENSDDLCTKIDHFVEEVENPGWLERFEVTWTRCENPRKKMTAENVVAGKLRWHQFYVEEPYKLFSLWGEVHPTQTLFPVENRGKQTYACYIVCAGMTRITAPEYWTSKTLDAIVMCGDKYYTVSNIQNPEYPSIDFRYLAKNFRIGETMFQGKLLPTANGRLYSKSENSLWKCLENMFFQHPFGVVTCESTCVGVFKFCGAYYMCDVRSTGPPIFQHGDGVVYLIRTTCFTKFMIVLTLTIASGECSEFQINPIQICNVVEVGRMTCFQRIRPNKLLKRSKFQNLRFGGRKMERSEKKKRSKNRSRGFGNVRS